MASEDELYDRSALRQLFDACDPSGSGFISKQSLLDGCQRLQLDDLTPEDVDVLFEQLATEDESSSSDHVSFERFVESFTNWAASQQHHPHLQQDGGEENKDEADGGGTETGGVQVTVLPPAAEEEFTSGPKTIQSFTYESGPSETASCNVVLATVTDADLDELVRKFDADTSGVSLRDTLMSAWDLSERQAHEVVDHLNIHMTEVNIRRVLAESLKDLGFSVSVPLRTSMINVRNADSWQVDSTLGPAAEQFSPAASASSSRPGSARRRTMTAAYSPAASPNTTRRESVRRRSHTMTRNITLADANIGELKNRNEVRGLWEDMKATQPELLDGFANFLDGVSQQLEEAERQKEQLKSDLNRECRDLDRRAVQLDEEAAQQIELEKAKVKSEERKRLRQMRQDLLKEIEERDKKLESAMEHLGGLQQQVQTMNARERTMEGQYGEMEKMKTSLEEALDAQRQKQKELEQQINESSASGQDSPPRPVSGPRLSGSDHEMLTQHIESLHSYSSDQQLVPPRQPPVASSFPSSPTPNVVISSTPRSKYTSDEDTASSAQRREKPGYSPRTRHSGSFRRSGKRPRQGASPRLARAPVKHSAAAEFGDDEGSPGEEHSQIKPISRVVGPLSSGSDSDLQIDGRQAKRPPSSSSLGWNDTRRTSGGGQRSLTDTEGMQTKREPPRRTSLSPDDLVSGRYQPGSLHERYDDDQVDGPCQVISGPVSHHAAGSLSGADPGIIPQAAPPPVFSPPPEISPSDEGTTGVTASTGFNDRILPLASIQPMQDDQWASPMLFGRSQSVRVKSPRRAARRGGPGAEGGTRSGSPGFGGSSDIRDVSTRFDLSSSKSANVPVVVHPIKANPAQHSTVQYPITAELVSEMGGIQPERVFKVVFCGDSGVGKTSYIWRICNEGGEFNPSSFSSTIGVDFQTKLLNIAGHQTVLKLWDTAGQERFRTFTQQYFRKADGVIIMYDVCNDQTFLNVRTWMEQIQEATGDRIAVMLLGNKVDMADTRPTPRRKVTYWQGQQLAQQGSALFAEVSAKTGHCVKETIVEMGKVLMAAEQETMEGLLQLDPNAAEPAKKKGGCCN